MRHVDVRVQTAAAGLAAGGVTAGILALVERAWASAPGPSIMAVSAGLAVFGLVPALPRRPALSAMAAAVVLLLASGAALPPGPLAERWAVWFPSLVGAAAGVAVSVFKVELLRAPRQSALLVLALALLLPCVEWPVSLLVSALGVALAGAPSGSLRNFGVRRQTFSLFGFLVAGAWWGAALAALAVVRPSTLPAPAFVHLVIIGLVGGWLLPVGRVASGGIGLITLGWAGASLAGVVGEGWSLPAWGLGAAGGALVRAWAAGSTALLVPFFAALLSLPIARVLPAAWQARGASAVASAPAAIAERLAGLRSGAEASTSWSQAGAVQWWTAQGIRLVELDGAAVGGSSRGSNSERLAGTLAGCAARSRGRVRIVGDDFGRAAGVVRGFGFEGVDVASLDRSLAGAVAEADPVARATWLSADVRLLQLPPGALLGAGGRASAVIEIVRVGWRDARTAWPDASRLARHAARVDDAGAHVLLLPGVGVELSALQEVLHSFAAVWPVVAVYAPPEGAEELIVVGTAEPVSWDSLSLCTRSTPWLRPAGLATALEVGSLVIGDHHAIARLPAGSAPGVGLPAPTEALPVTALFDAASESAHAFSGPVPDALAERQATRRAALQVLRASAGGDIRLALERARGLAGEPGAGVAIDPMVEPLLERARSVAVRAAAEGERSELWSEADSVIEAALLMNPGSASARCMRGDFAYARREADEALRWYTECAVADPQEARAFQGIGAAQKALGRLEEAETALRESARLAPDDWATQLNLGNLLRQVGKLEEAESVLRGAEHIASQSDAPGRTRIHLALARLYLQTGRAELALAQARRAEVEEPSADSAFWTGAAQYELAAWSEAEAAYRTALRRNEKLLDAREGLGLCLARRGDYQGAAEAFRTVLSLDPRRALAREKLELLKPLLGAQAEAVRAAGSPPAP